MWLRLLYTCRATYFHIRFVIFNLNAVHPVLLRSKHKNGSTTENARRQRKGQQICDNAWQCTQILESERRTISRGALALGAVHLCCVWISDFPNHTVDSCCVKWSS
ncbi:hypothetical protein ACLKA6_011756 [Drosophila palustris]